MRRAYFTAIAVAATAAAYASPAAAVTGMSADARTAEGSRADVHCEYAREAAAEVISERPEGRHIVYKRSGTALFPNNNGIYIDNYTSVPGEVVYGEDGVSVWLRNPVSKYAVGTWVKGTLSDGGTKISVPAGQCINYVPSQGYRAMLYLLEKYTYEQDGETLQDYRPVADAAITYTVSGDNITLDCTSEDRTVGIIWDDTAKWSGFCDWNMVYSPMDDVAVTLPAGAEPQVFSMTYQDTYFKNQGKILKVAKTADSVYIQGLSSDCPEGWVKGEFDGSKATFQWNQYVGPGAGYFVYFKPVRVEEGYDEGIGKYYDFVGLKALTLTYDAASGAFTADNSIVMSAGKDGISRVDAYLTPKFSPYEEKAAVPADAESISYFDYMEKWGYSYCLITIPSFDTDGNYIDGSKLKYKLYVDDDVPVVFTTATHPYISEDMEEIPYEYTENFDIMPRGSSIYFPGSYTRAGVQSVYYGGGERRVSNIVYSDGSISTGIDEIQDVPRCAKSCEYYDVTGRRVDGRAKGLVIKVVTYDDGSVESLKTINR